MRRNRLSAIALMLLSVAAAMAQMPEIPQDPEVKIGHLDNGLTYYIRHNAFPAGKATYYIANKVGSLQEEESQRGVAHLLEHLAFNGTEHFQDNTLMQYVKSNGATTNAETGVDHTTYYISNMPTRPTAVDSCILILKDWSNGITLTSKAIDDERDVVHNEYRQSVVGASKIQEQLLPQLYPGSKYGQRFPLGLMSVIDGCDPEDIRDFYAKWYRPDNQALIIVGDVEVEVVEGKIKELFSGIKVPANAAKVVPEQIPDNDEAIYAIGKDKEMLLNQILVFLKHDVPSKEEKKSAMYLVRKFADYAIAQMFNGRCKEKAQDPQCPYMSAAGGTSNYYMSQTKDAFTMYVIPKQDKDAEAFAALLTEVKRVADHGFTSTEFSRAKEEYVSTLENAYTNRDKMKNEEFSTQYVDHFISGEPIVSVEHEYMLMKQLVPNIPVEMINERAKEIVSLSDHNFVTCAMLSEKDGATYPTSQQFAEAKAKVCSTPVEAYVDNVKQEPLMAETPKAGSVVATTENKALGYKELQLSNGAKVILKKTDFKDNEVLFSAWAKGGYSGYPESKAVQMNFLEETALFSGRGNFSNTELQKALSGKQVKVTIEVEEYSRNISGKSTPKDLEVLMQLIHLSMTDISKDEKNFENFRKLLVTALEGQKNTPDIVYEDSVQNTLHQGSKFEHIPTADEINALNYDEILSDLKDFYGNAKDFTFMFAGNFDEQTILPLINTYIASLPNNGKVLNNKQLPFFKGEVKNVFTRAMANPNNHDTEYWCSDAAPNTVKNRILAAVAGRMLYENYFRVIREKLSATYSPTCDGGCEYTASGEVRYYIKGDAELNPDKCDVALPYMLAGMKELATAPNLEDLQKTKETFVNNFEQAFKTNKYWLGVVKDYKMHDIDKHTTFMSTLKGITQQDVKDFVNNIILKSGNHATVLMRAVKN